LRVNLYQDFSAVRLLSLFLSSDSRHSLMVEALQFIHPDGKSSAQPQKGKERQGKFNVIH
jgi:hypothetical protein